MKKLIKCAVGMLAVLMLIACGESKTNDVSTNLLENNETIEIPSKPVSEPQKENDGKDVIESVDNELEEVTKEVVFLNVKSSEDAIANIIAEGTDKDEYLSAKDYIEKVKARGMGDTLADTLAVFNRCGFEYYGSDIICIDEGVGEDDLYSQKVIITSDGDKLFYLRTEYNQVDMESGYQDYMLWRINDDKQYELLINEVTMSQKMFSDYMVIDHTFPVSIEEEEMADQEINYASNLKLRLMKNSVYASKGRKFTSPDLAAIFETQSWYKGTIEAKEFDNNLEKYLSKEEQAYINKIVKKQEECDMNKAAKNTSSLAYEACKLLLNGSCVDVNGDGKKDRLIWGWKDIGELNVYVQLADGPELTFDHSGEGTYFEVYYIDSVYLGKCLLTSEYGPSDDARTEIRTIDGNECVRYDDLYVYPYDIEFYNDHIVAGFRGYHINTEEIRTDYVLTSDGKFVEHNSGYYEYRGNTVTTLMDIQTFADRDDSKAGITIKKGNDLIILGGDLDKWVKVKEVNSGTECWLMTDGGSIVFTDGTKVYTNDAMTGIIVYD